ncbi:MAG: hypothetical protein ACI92I_000780 [Acidimicrobiales bacterium]
MEIFSTGRYTMNKLVSRLPDLSTKEAMCEVVSSVQAIGKVVNQGTVFHLSVYACQQHWETLFNPHQSKCFLIDSNSVYQSAVLALKTFGAEIVSYSDSGVQSAVVFQIARLDCLREKTQ